MYYIDEFLKKNRPKTFMDYAPGEIPKKTTTTVGAIHESPAKASNLRATSIPAETYNTYTTSDKDLQNIHKNRTNAERHTGRSLRDESNRRTTYVGDDAHIVPHSRENDSYGSPVKIVGDNVTKKDYDDFWNAFRNEGAGSKLNWAANQMQAQPKQQQTNVQTTPQNRYSQDMMQWSMRQIKNLVEPHEIGRKRYITDEDEAFRQGFFGEDYENNEELRQRVNSAIRDSRMRRAGDILRTSLEPENNIATRYTENASERPLRKRYDIPEPGRYGWLSTEEGQKALDDVSLALSAGSLIPGADTFTDLASIPVDLLRGDYISVAFDAFGLIPLYGEVGDAAKLARIGANAIDTATDASRVVKAGAEVLENTDDVIDFAKYTNDIIETAKSADNIAEQLIEESERIRSSIDYAIKKDLTSSREFVRKFNTIADDSNMRREIYNEVKDILHHRSGTNGEDLLYYNPRLKKWYRSRSGIEAGKPAYTDDIILGLKENANNELIAFHNHPAGMPPSVEDLNAALKNGYAKGYTIGHNGRIFEYTAPRERISIFLYENRLAKYLKQYNEFEAQYMTMQDLSRLYGFYFREVK